MNDVPPLFKITRTVAQLSEEIPEEIGFVMCESCERYWPQDWMMKAGSRFRNGVDVYLCRPTCRVCHEDELREDDGHSGWFEIKDQPRSI